MNEALNILKEYKKSAELLDVDWKEQARTSGRTDIIFIEKLSRLEISETIDAIRNFSSILLNESAGSIREYCFDILFSELESKSQPMSIYQVLALYESFDKMYQKIDDLNYKKLNRIIQLILHRLEKMIPSFMVEDPAGNDPEYKEKCQTIVRVASAFSKDNHLKPSPTIMSKISNALSKVVSNYPGANENPYLLIFVRNNIPIWATKAKRILEDKILEGLVEDIMHTSDIQCRFNVIKNVSSIRHKSKGFNKKFCNKLATIIKDCSIDYLIFFHTNRKELSRSVSTVISAELNDRLSRSILEDQKNLYTSGNFYFIDKEIIQSINKRTIELFGECTWIGILNFICNPEIPHEIQKSIISSLGETPYYDKVVRFISF